MPDDWRVGFGLLLGLGFGFDQDAVPLLARVLLNFLDDLLLIEPQIIINQVIPLAAVLDTDQVPEITLLCLLLKTALIK